MSLQVWLPLNGDLNNQGLSDIVLNNSGITYTDGKIGQAANFSSSYIGITNTPITGSIDNFSFCFWLKTSSPSSTMCLYNGRTSTGGPCGIFIIEGHLRFDDGEQHNLTYNIPSNIWEHYTITRNSSDIKLYVNGELTYTTTATAFTCNATKATIGVSSTNSLTGNNSNYFVGQLNDYRIYDHCLSPKEVKEISKGLVLHYPLNDPYVEDTVNITKYKDYGISNSECYNNSKGTYGYGTKTDMYISTGEFQGKQCTKVYMGTAGADAWPYVFFNPLHPSNGQYKTLSFDYYPTVQDKIKFYTFDGAATLTSTVNGVAVDDRTMNVNLNQWNHITVTLLGTSDSTSGWGYMMIGNRKHTSTTTDYWLFANVQIEEKDHATPYTSSSRSENIVYDCSGFSNNGTKIGTITLDSDTPRYMTSYQMISSNVGVSTDSGMTTIYSNGGLTAPAEITIAFWLKPIQWNYQNSGLLSTTMDSYPSDYTTSAINQYDSAFRFNASDGNYLMISATSLINDFLWHHYSFVFDGINIKVYKDGTLTSLGKSFSSTKTLGSFNKVFIGLSQAGGAWRQTSAYWSDFRVYSTALSAEDIKKLYNTPISIDNQGNMYCYEFVENDLNNFSSKGIVTNSEFIDLDSAGDNYTKAAVSATTDYANIFIEK